MWCIVFKILPKLFWEFWLYISKWITHLPRHISLQFHCDLSIVSPKWNNNRIPCCIHHYLQAWPARKPLLSPILDWLLCVVFVAGYRIVPLDFFKRPFVEHGRRHFGNSLRLVVTGCNRLEVEIAERALARLHVWRKYIQLHNTGTKINNFLHIRWKWRKIYNCN